MINILEVILGAILALIASVVLGFVFSSIGSYFGFLAVSILIGYSDGENILNGAIYGILICLIAGIIFTLSMFFMWIFGLGGLSASTMEFGLTGIIIGLIIDAIIGAAGGAIGSSINNKNFN